MRILFTSFYFPPAFQGGAEISAATVGCALVEQGHEVHVLTRDHAADYDDAFHVHSRLRSRELPKELTARSTRKHVEDMLDRFDFDIVHAQNEYTAVGAAQACHGTGTPCAVSLRDYWLLDPLRLCHDFTSGSFTTDTSLTALLGRAWRKFSYDGGLKRWLSPAAVLYLERFRRYERGQIGAADALLANSDFVRDAHADVHPNVRTLYNAVDTDTFTPTGETDEGGDRTRLLFVGRPRPEKGIGTLIAALGRLDEDVVLDVAGTDRAPGWLQHNIERHGVTDRIRFRGRLPRDDLVRAYRSADIVAFPSEWQEPFGRISIEAMACATPVVATRVGGIPEVVDDGETGLLVEPGDPAELADAVDALAADPERREEMGRAGRETVEDRFAPGVIADAHIDAYEGVIG